MRFLTRTVAPSALITLDEAKEQCRVAHNDEDLLIERLALAAADYLDGPEGAVGICLALQTWQVSFKPDELRIRVPIVPAIALTALEYFDTENAVQTLDVADYLTFYGSDSSYIEPKNGKWPTVYDRPDAVTATITAGKGAPENIRHAALLMVAHWYNHREAVSGSQATELPMAAQMLIAKSRIGWVA